LTSQLKGGPLTVVKDVVDRKDIKLNKVWLLPFVKKNADKVPSAFFIADVFLAMDVMLFGKLLRPLPDKGDSKVLLALAEAQRVKCLFSYLRYLWRASPVARDRDINELKAFMVKPTTVKSCSEPEGEEPEEDTEDKDPDEESDEDENAEDIEKLADAASESEVISFAFVLP
jgi:hypothetical protein